MKNILSKFDTMFKNPTCELHYKTPFQLLVAVILSAQCTDKRVNLVTDELFKTQKNFNTLKNEIKRMMDEYDRLKIEKQELDQQLTRAEQQIDTLSKQLLLARHSADNVNPDNNEYIDLESFTGEDAGASGVDGFSGGFGGGVSGDAFFPAGDDIYDED